MPRTRVYEAVTERLEILDTEGRVDERPDAASSIPARSAVSTATWC